MKVSDAIKALKLILKQSGDLELVSLTDIGDSFCIERDRIFDVVKPDDYEHYVCAYMEEVDLDEGEPARPDLKIVKGKE